MTASPRSSIYRGKNLLAFLASGRTKAPSDSARIDALARRYAYLIAELLPRRMQVTADELCYLASMLEEWTLGDPSDVMVLALRLQQQADRRMHVSGLDISTLAYRMKALKPAEVLALLDAAERVHAAADPQSARQVADDIVTSMGRSA